MILRRNQKAFTIVELIGAMAVFSFLLLLVTYGFVQINRTYTRGITTKTIQETSRVVLEDITRAIRLSEQTAISNAVVPVDNGGRTHYTMQVGDQCYAWNQYAIDGTGNYVYSNGTYSDTGEPIVFAKANSTDCSIVSDELSENLLDERAIIQHIEIEELGAGTNTYRLKLVVSTSNADVNDLVEFGEDAQCDVGIGDQFCDVVTYETSVKTRN